MNLNFKISELIYSETAIKNNINNMPDINSLDNILLLILNCLQPIRDKINKPMIITSGFRNSKVNKLIGGSSTSEHLKGMAVDFKINGLIPTQIIEIIKKMNIKWTQLIDEYGKNGARWVHISYNQNNLKNEILIYKNNRYIKVQ